MVQRLSASPEQHLQRPACMFEAAFICIYRELGLTVCVWKLVPLIAVAFSLEKSTAGFQMLESPLAHFHTLSRGDSLGAFATTLACGGRIQPLLRRRLPSCQASVNGDYWWLVFGLYWFWNCEGWWGSNSLLWKSTWWHVMQAFHGVFPPVRSECFKSSILHGSNEGLIGGFDHRHLERNSKVQQERLGAGVGLWRTLDFEGYDFEIFGGFKRFRFLGHNGHILQLTWKVFSLMFDLPELRLPNKKAVEVQRAASAASQAAQWSKQAARDFSHLEALVAAFKHAQQKVGLPSPSWPCR